MTLEQLKKVADKLPPHDRTELAEYLLESAAFDISERRFEEMRLGLVQPVDEEEAFRQMGLTELMQEPLRPEDG